MIEPKWSWVALSAVLIAGIVAAAFFKQDQVVMILSGVLVGKEALQPSVRRIKKVE